MPELNSLLVFFSASLVLVISPGPDNMFVIAQSMQNGRLAGFLVTLGLLTGLVVHTLAVVLGLAALLQASVIAFTLLKFVGAAYLLYLAFGAFRAADSEKRAAAVSLSRAGLYRRGIFMNLSNPKVSLFFLAFLPQFADPSRGPVAPQLLLLGLLFIVAVFFVFVAICLIAGEASRWLVRSDAARRFVGRMTGVVLASLAVKLFFSER